MNETSSSKYGMCWKSIKTEGTSTQAEMKNELRINFLQTKEYVQKVSRLKVHRPKQKWGCPRGVMVKAIALGIVVHEFVLQSRYYVHFRANTLGKSMNPLILLAMG